MVNGRKVHFPGHNNPNESHENKDANHASSQLQQKSETEKMSNTKRKKNQ